MLTLSAHAQRGGITGAGASDGGCNSYPPGYGHATGAAGLDTSKPCPQPALPPASDPAVKARLDHEQNIKDATRLAQLAAEVKQDLENSADFTLSVASLKKLEEMAKLSKTLHDRVRAGDASAPKAPRVSDASDQTGPKK